MTQAHECTEAEIESLFFVLTPIKTTKNANNQEITLLDFTDSNKAVCDEAKDFLANGDSHSDDFLDSFCECSIHIGYDILTQENIDCDINGLNVKDLKSACGQRYCNQATDDADVRSKCFCEGSWLVETVPPNLASTTQSEQISTYCLGV